MSYVTTHLEGESGIQYRGVEDKTNINQIGNMSNMLMLVEDVPRGRLDQEMTITKANKAAFLGVEKGNLYLQAVDDALDQNVPSIKVMRVNTNDGCQAVGLSADPNNQPLLPNVELHIDYRINNGLKSRFTYLHTVEEGPQTINYVYTIFNAFLNFLETYEHSGLNQLVVGGSGGLAYFQKLGYGTLVGASLSQVEGPDPANITLYAVAGQVNDPIQTLFGVNQVTAHSCGAKVWEGY